MRTGVTVASQTPASKKKGRQLAALPEHIPGMQNRWLIIPNIALQRDSLRESKGSQKRHRGLSSAGCGGSESAGSIQQMGRRLRQAKVIPKKLFEK